MAAKKPTITVQIGFNAETESLNKIAKKLNSIAEKGFSSGKGKDYFNSLTTGANKLTKEMQNIIKQFNKPFSSKNQVSALMSNLDKNVNSLDKKLLSLQGNITKTLDSASNTGLLQQIKDIGKEIDRLNKMSDKLSETYSKRKSYGSNKSIEESRSQAKKTIQKLDGKTGALTKEEKAQRREAIKLLDIENQKLAEKNKLTEEYNKILEKSGYSSKEALDAAIKDKTGEQAGLMSGTLTEKEGNSLINLLSTVRGLLQEIGTAIGIDTVQAEQAYDAGEEAATEAERASKTFKDVWRELGLPLLSLQSMAHTMKQVIRYSFDYIKNLDTALTEISVVSGKTRSEVMGLTDTFIELSAQTGMAIDDIAKASVVFYQQGLGDAAVKKLTEYTAIFAKISGETVETASDQITAAINGFGYAYTEVEQVVDKMSVLAAHSAASIDELATAMSKGAAQANQAGLSFDQYNAYLATMIEATREAPENIGTSMKTIISRIQQIKEGNNTEDDVEVNDVEKALRSVNVALRDETGQLRDLDEVLGDLGPKWKTFDRNTQAYLGTIIAGTRQQSRFITLMQNWDRVLELIADSENSAGAVTEMHEAAMNSLSASLNTLTNAWQRLISNLMNGDDFKWIVDLVAGFVKWLGNGSTSLKLFALAIGIWNAKTILQNIQLAKQKQSYINLDTALTKVKGTAQDYLRTLQNLTTQESLETKEIQNQTRALELNTQARQKNNAAKGTSVASVGGGVDTPDAGDIPVSGGGFWSKIKGKVKGGASNLSSMLGKAQIAITAAVTYASIVTAITDVLTTTASEIKEKYQEQYEETDKLIKKNTELIETVEKSGEIYEKLSRKVIKTEDEIKKLDESIEKLAEAVPEAIDGYDAQGKAIINLAKARELENEAIDERAEAAKDQIGNIGGLALGDLREEAEKKVAAEHNFKAAKTIGKTGMYAGAAGVAGIASTLMAGGAGASATGIGAIGGIPMMIAGGLLLLGTAIFGVSSAMENAAVKTEAYNAAVEKAKKVQQDYGAELAQQFSIIGQRAVGKNALDGTTGEQRAELASYMSTAWVQDQMTDLFRKLQNKEIKEKDYEKQFKALGDKWEGILTKIGTSGLATAYKELDQVADGVEDKTYNSVKVAIDKIIKNDLGISEDDESFKSLETAFMNAAFKGTANGIHNAINNLKQQRDALKETGGDTTAYDTAINNLSGMSTSEGGFYASTGITDDVDLFNAIYASYRQELQRALVDGTEKATIEAIAILSRFKEQGGELGEAAAAAIDKAWSNLALAVEPTWRQLFEMYEQFTDRVATTRGVLAELKSEGSIDYEQWKGLTSLFDDIDTDMLNTSDLESYANALNTIADNLVLVNGELQLNQKAMKTVGKLEETLADAQIDGVKNQLLAKKAQLEAQKAVVQADLNYMKVQLEVAQSVVDGTYSETEATADLDTAKQQFTSNAALLLETFNSNEHLAAQNYAKMWTTAFDAVAEEYNKLMYARSRNIPVSNMNIKETLEGSGLDLKPSTEGLYDFKGMNKDQAKGVVDELKKKIAAAEKTIGGYDVAIGNINLKLATLRSGLRKTGDAFDKSSKAVEKYTSKLRELLNLLTHIEREEFNLKIAETLEEMQRGKDVIREINKEIEYSIHLQGDYTKLKTAYEKEANDAAKDLRKSFGDIVKFDPNGWGNYEVDLSKYNKLNDKQKELFDNALESYDEIIKKRDESYENFLKYTKLEIDAEQKKVDKYIDAEKDLVEAVKAREKKILDAKLKAIGKEIEAIEKVSEARRKAREEENDAAEMSGLQVDLQRALMDSSGASASQILSLQKQIKDKQKEMADNSFDTMVDDMKQQLEDEKQMEQDLFDERLEEMDWYWNEVSRIMGEGIDNVLDTMKLYGEEYNQASEIQQTEILKGWQDTFDQALAIGEQGTKDLQTHITTLQTKINGLAVDERILTKDTINTKFDKHPDVKDDTGNNSNNNKKKSGRTYGTKTNIKTGNGTETKHPIVYTITLDNGYSACSYQKVNAGNSCNLPTLTRSGYTFKGWYIPSLGKTKTGSYIPTNSEVITGRWEKITSKEIFTNISNNKTNRKSTIPGKIFNNITRNANGGMIRNTGLQWLDGTRANPEAVLNATQTKAFLSFTDDLAALRASGAITNNSNVVIDTISFNVESMSSPEDGEKAFDAFVDRFKQIGAKQGISINGTANRF